ncbi:calcium-binding protein [Rhodobacter sp. CZR27]|uniref:calcium-binding protein n=1 Tax=Rhodobacter sp. CZR27 TaxID=2033869 RepID=UPI000BBF2B43|nr:calcium-binding protein [Rhodobacter sp. CZR27]
MPNNTYVIDQIALNGQTVILADDGDGIDWLVFRSVHPDGTEIDLSWTYTSAGPTSGEGIYYIGNSGSRLIVNGVIENARGSDGSDWIDGNTLGNLIMGDQFRFGPGGNDTIFGDDGDDTVHGGGGNDSINGAEDNDLLYGGDGADTIGGSLGFDTIEGGTGADSLSGGADGGDTLSYSTSGAGVRVRLTYGDATTLSGGDAQGDVVRGFNDVVGSAHADVITDLDAGAVGFGYNSNRFFGGGGNDTLRLGGNTDSGWGGAGSDTIYGEQGNDLLYGDVGLDRLIGGEGRDLLTGGLSADRFVFLSALDSGPTATTRDRIVDFNRVEGDRIDLMAIDANLTAAGNQAFRFVGTGGFDRAGDLRISGPEGALVVSGDLNGDGAADFSILVSGLAAMRGADFLL